MMSNPGRPGLIVGAVPDCRQSPSPSIPAAIIRLRLSTAVRDARQVQTHDNQLAISAQVARTLIDRQFPQWRGLPVRHVAAAGTVNAIFRIGDRSPPVSP
jgi:hypothetical protein